jgi:hypothetical protein
MAKTLTVHKLAQNEKSNVVLLRYSVELGDTGLSDTIYGWHESLVKRKVGDTIDLPDNANISIDTRTSVDEETGQELSFDWMKISL